MRRQIAVMIVAYGVMAAPFVAEASNPYSTPEESPPPVAADGTIQWGVFYKDPAIQKAYERLWSLGACRNTNRAITVPVEENKLIIDRLPESDFEGRVVAVTGALAGGMISFQQAPAGQASPPLVAQLHPAAVTRLQVLGRAPASMLRPGHVIRFMAEVDDKGRVAQPVTAFEIVTPSADFKPDPVRPGARGEIVAAVRSLSGNVAVLHLPAGKVRRITLEITADAIATLDAAQLDVVAPGDSITLRGRIWTGEGALGAGTVFASEVTVTKPAMPGEVAAADGRQANNRP